MPEEQKLGHKLKKQIREIYSVASEKTEEYAKVGKKRLDILSLSRDVSREKKTLGERVYELSRRPGTQPVLEDVTVKAILSRISSLEEEIQDREAEIGRIREEAKVARERRESDRRPAGVAQLPEDAAGGEPAAVPGPASVPGGEPPDQKAAGDAPGDAPSETPEKDDPSPMGI